MKNEINKNVDYTVVGRLKGNKDDNYYLIYVCGSNEERALEVLEKARKEERLLEKYDDFKLNQVESKDAWWY